MDIYIGDSKDVIKRILRNHCNGNVEASALRKSIAEYMGFKLKKSVRRNGSKRIRIDLPNDKLGENAISVYIKSGEWKYVIYDSYKLAHDFQWYVIEQLKPQLNKILKSWNAQNVNRYKILLNNLIMAAPFKYNDLNNKIRPSGPGIYLFLHNKMPNDFKTFKFLD